MISRPSAVGGDVATVDSRLLDEPQNPLIMLPQRDPCPWESEDAVLYWPVLSSLFNDRMRSSVAKLPLLPGLGAGPVPLIGRRVEKCGIVVTGVMVEVIAALLFRVPISLPGIGRLAVLIDEASETRLS